MFCSQGRCYLTGLTEGPLVDLGYDRENSQLRGYPENDNIEPCLGVLNMMKGDLPLEEFLTICMEVYQAWGPTLEGW